MFLWNLNEFFFANLQRARDVTENHTVTSKEATDCAYTYVAAENRKVIKLLFRLV